MNSTYLLFENQENIESRFSFHTSILTTNQKLKSNRMGSDVEMLQSLYQQVFLESVESSTVISERQPGNLSRGFQELKELLQQAGLS